MPFDGTDTRAAKAVAMIDALLAYFDGGQNWLQADFHEGDQRCLISAMAHIRHRDKLNRDPTSQYIKLAAAVSLPLSRSHPNSIIAINDHCRDYQQLAGILEQARTLAATGESRRARAEIRKRYATVQCTQAERQIRDQRQLLEAIHKAERAFREAADRYAADHGERSPLLDERTACAQRELASVSAA
jgi:hypothetical protein